MLTETLFFIVKKCSSIVKFGVVLDYCSLELLGKQFKQNASPKSHKTEIKIVANPGLA